MSENLYPLSYPQKTIWYMEKLYNGSNMTSISGTFKIIGKVDLEKLNKAINLFVSNNEGMRIRLVEKDGEVMQYVAPFSDFETEIKDFSNSKKEDIYKWEEEVAKIPISGIDVPLFKFIIMKISDNEVSVYIKTNHIISDAWTMMLIPSGVVDIYSKLLADKEIGDEKPSYIDYLEKEKEYFESSRFKKDEEYWKEKMSDFEDVTSLKESKLDNRETKAERKTYILPEKLTNKMHEFCKENNVSEYALFISGLFMYINRVTGKEKLIFGTSLLNRNGAKEKETVGMFTSTAIPLKVDITDNMNFDTFVKNVSKEIMGVLRHQRFPYENLLNLVKENDKSINKLFDIVLNYQNAKFENEEKIVECSTRWHFNGEQIESLIVNVNDRDGVGEIIINYDYLINVFCEKEIEFVHKHIISILWHALDNPKNKLSKLEMLSEAEKKQILVDFNDTACEYHKEKTLDMVFEEQVLKTPNNIAVICDDKRLTYKELDDRAEKLAYKLRNEGVKPDDIVGIIMYRSLEMIIGVLGIHKAGAAYMPIDPDYPEDRIKYMLENSGSKVTITHSAVNIRVDTVRNIEVSNEELLNEESKKVQKIHNSKNIAYVIYTSGSTGKPKGVMIEHWSAINRINWMQKHTPLDETDVILQKTPYTFDVSVWELVWWYFVGAKVCMLEPGAQKYPDKIVSTIEKYNVTTMHFVPSMLNAFLEYVDVAKDSNRLKSLRRVFASGEALLIDQVKKYNRLIFNETNAPLINLYGPTEATVDVSYFDCSPTPTNGIIPIGKPIDNIQLYVLDNNKNLMPIGIIGELYIAGDGLARGYVNNKKLTDEKFVDNPFTTGTKMYKTGDLCRWMPRGDIEYIGRVDFQIKIRGFRIEIGEIEARLKDFEDIKESVVIINTEEKTGIKNLCAYFTAKSTINTKELKEFLGTKMPSYMVPSYYMQLDSMPLSANGKLDRKQLPKIEMNEEIEIILPETEEQKILVDLFKEILCINELGINQNIFELGADSLKIISAVTRLIKYNWDIGIQDFYKYPTIQALSNKILHKDIQEDENITLDIQKVPEFKDTSIEKEEIKNVFLTGATGFLGVHILKELLEKTTAKVYCLVREGKDKKASDRLLYTLDFYFDGKYKELLGDRVEVLSGDVSLQNFGLEKSQYELLGGKIDSIIHSAAMVKYYGEYDEVKRVNVDGVTNIINFAKKYKIKLNHISTITVTGEYLVDNGFTDKIFSEKDFYIGQKYLENIYVRSKFEGENQVLKAINEGLNATIFRIGNLTGRSEDGKFQKNISENAFYDAIKSIFEKGKVTDELAKKMIEFTAVDKASEAIVKICETSNSSRRVFHICNNNLISVKQFLEYSEVVNGTKESDSKKSMGMIYLDESGNILLESGIDVKSEITDEFLGKLGFKWPEIDKEYINKIIAYMKREKYID